jgi:hypothetical protein
MMFGGEDDFNDTDGEKPSGRADLFFFICRLVLLAGGAWAIWAVLPEATAP